jgi:hypothetical protein
MAVLTIHKYLRTTNAYAKVLAKRTWEVRGTAPLYI